jgi:hypothetical protein
MKTSKINIAIAFAFILSGLTANAQKSGVYKSYADYVNGKFEVSIDCGTENGKIKPNDFFSKDYLTVIKAGKKHDLKKEEIYGYQLCNGKFFRFLNKTHIPLEEKGIIWIYSKDVFETVSPKAGTKRVKQYYFSKGGDGEIKYLSLKNLKAAFIENDKLVDAIDTQFTSDLSLKSFDTSHKMFKINHFLEDQGL